MQSVVVGLPEMLQKETSTMVVYHDIRGIENLASILTDLLGKQRILSRSEVGSESTNLLQYPSPNEQIVTRSVFYVTGFP